MSITGRRSAITGGINSLPNNPATLFMNLRAFSHIDFISPSTEKVAEGRPHVLPVLNGKSRIVNGLSEFEFRLILAGIRIVIVGNGINGCSSIFTFNIPAILAFISFIPKSDFLSIISPLSFVTTNSPVVLIEPSPRPR